MDATDQELVARARAAKPGDLRAFDELVSRHQARVRTNCRYLSGNDEDALDLSQEVLVKAYFNLRRFEERSSFGTWINRIKVNHCLNHLRRRADAVVDIDDEAVAGHDALRSRERTDAAVDADEKRQAIGRSLDALPETLRVPLVLRDLDGYSYQDIADELRIGLSAVKMRIKRARSEFRGHYQRERGIE